MLSGDRSVKVLGSPPRAGSFVIPDVETSQFEIHHEAVCAHRCRNI
jgi:hypothetical protein